MAIKGLRRIQLGRESVAGTAVAATTRWRGVGMLDDQKEVVFVDEDIGIPIGTDRSYIPYLQGAIEMEATPLTFEQLPHILEASLMTATPVQDGTGSDYIYTYDIPESAAPTIKTYTIEGGDDQQARELENSFVSEFTLEGEAKQAWMMGAQWVGRQLTDTTFTGGATIPVVEDALFQKTKLYIDNVGGSFGSTLKSQTLLKSSLKITSGWIPVFTGDGELYFSFTKWTRPVVELSMQLEFNATAVAERANWDSQTPRLIQLLCEGSDLQTPGTTYAVKTFIQNLVGKWSRFEKIGERDGNDVIDCTFIGRYNETQADAGAVIVVNELSALP